LTEERFIDLLRQGDQQAFRELVSQFSDRIYNTAVSLLQHEEDAEDITQEVFTEVFQSIRNFRGGSKLSTWVYRITVTKSLEHLRKTKRQKRTGTILSLFGQEDRIHVPGKEPFFHPGVRLENKEMATALFAAIRKLPLSQRTAFTLHKMENLSYADLADAMGVSVSSAESLMSRAKKRLRELLRDYYEQNVK
jgi:RNA polymerase sigma factor (sigma-70 family)